MLLNLTNKNIPSLLLLKAIPNNNHPCLVADKARVFRKSPSPKQCRRPLKATHLIMFTLTTHPFNGVYDHTLTSMWLLLSIRRHPLFSINVGPLISWMIKVNPRFLSSFL
ncbi:hypothetical protein Hanom_Chr07g00619451 [Helianthus anomalus]